MSTYREFRNDFIKLNPQVLAADTVGMFISQSAGTGTIFIAGMIVPYSTTQGSIEGRLRHTKKMYVEYTVDTTYPGGEFPYLPASGSGGAYAIRTIEIPIKEVQSRDTHYFFEPVTPVRIPAQLNTFGTPSENFLRISFSGPENYYKDDFNPISNNISDARKSNVALVVDRFAMSPSQGGYIGSLLPNNFTVIQKALETRTLFNSGSMQSYESTLRNRELIDREFFAEIQDSNYSTKSWTGVRYDGVEESNNGVVGNEPALSFLSFDGTTYPTGSTTSTIKAIADSDRKLESIYYVNFASGSSQYGKRVGGSTFLPLEGTTSMDLVRTYSNKRYTILYKVNGRTFNQVVNSKVYGSDRGEVYITDENGVVLRTE